MILEAFALTVAAEGHTVSGDTHVIRRAPEGSVVLVGVVDVLGHGALAAPVAETARDQLRATEAGSAAEVLRDLHRVLRGTRGAAALTCVFDGARFGACGVGNVNLRAVGCRVPVVLSPGILGNKVRHFHEFGGDLSQGGRLILYSDGIVSHFDAAVAQHLSAEDACHAIMSQFRRSHDDATVLVLDAK